ncbi:SWIM zinc finger family protein [Paraburkholderia hospita]|uniref:SWIM zinc finger family protein n=1 Tax=Paraburkholderia hospita TaxID=169430 RepID=UPI003899127A
MRAARSRCPDTAASRHWLHRAKCPDPARIARPSRQARSIQAACCLGRRNSCSRRILSSRSTRRTADASCSCPLRRLCCRHALQSRRTYRRR